MPNSHSESRATRAAPCATDTTTATAVGAVRVALVPRAGIGAWLAASGASLLATVTYGDVAAPGPADTPLHVHVPLRRLDGGDDVEVWTGGAAARAGRAGLVSFSVTGDALFGAIRLAQGDEPFEDTVQRAYADLLRAIDAQRMPYLLRVWNYFSGMNDDERGMERYQRFCLGRHRAFDAHYRGAMIERLPAASAIGTRDSELVICFLAARERGVHLENPRQVSAYQYPRQYGPASPSFARATAKEWPGGAALYLSGTASVVGHESRHVGDTAAQTRETIRNIEALFAAVPHPAAARFTMLKSYLRDPADTDTVRALLAQTWGAHTPLLMLQGDICRRELLLEIEGVCG